jgi:hypothetical protein
MGSQVISDTERNLIRGPGRMDTMIGYAAAFIHLLEMLKKGEGTDVIELGEEHEGALRLVTDTYAPA